MNLPNPVPGVDAGFNTAQDIQSSNIIIDAHTHAPGSGVPITPNGLNMNADLPLNNNDITGLRSTRYNPSTIASAPPDQGCVYVSGVDLFYNDFGGNAIQITASGGVNSGSGNIQLLPSSPAGAALTWSNSTNTFVFTGASANPGPSIDAGALIIRYPGSYPTPSGNAVVLQAPSALSGTYRLTLPLTLPSSANSFLTFDTSGTGSYVVPDGVTLNVSSAALQVAAGGIGTAQLASNAVTTGKINASAVVTGSIANGAVTGAKIASATVAGSNIVSNVALAGASVTAGSQQLVVANTNPGSGGNLSILRVAFNAAGTITLGEGATLSSKPGTGQWGVTFNTPFSSAPVVNVTCFSAGGGASYATVTAISAANFSVRTFNSSGGLVDPDDILIIAIGPR